MKFGMRKPSISRSIRARTTGRITRAAKKAVNPLYGKKGIGLVRDPKRAIKNRMYSRTTFSPTDFKNWPDRSSGGNSDLINWPDRSSDGDRKSNSGDSSVYSHVNSSVNSSSKYGWIGVGALVIFFSFLLIKIDKNAGFLFALIGSFIVLAGLSDSSETDIDNNIKENEIKPYVTDVENAEDEEDEEDMPEPVFEFVINKNSKIYHDPECPMAERISGKNRELFTGTEAELRQKKYIPCSHCMCEYEEEDDG